MQVTSGAGKINIPVKSVTFTEDIFDLYSEFNKKVFPAVVRASESLVDFIRLVYKSFKFSEPIVDTIQEKTVEINSDSKKVVLGFSAGLDSVCQAVLLRESGYDPVLFFVRNINTYENGQSWKYAMKIADKLNMSLVESSISKCSKSSEWHQSWPENPVKNQLILAMMTDYAAENGITKISLGDDFDLHIKDAVPGINLTDASELTKAFLEGIQSQAAGIEFVTLLSGHDKMFRLNKLFDYDLENDYYSCVQAGRFNKSIKRRVESKYGVDLLENNCGSCRKCCMHDLLMHYSGVKKFNEEFIDHCWKKMYDNAYSADYEFFRPDLPLEKRISNLYTY